MTRDSASRPSGLRLIEAQGEARQSGGSEASASPIYIADQAMAEIKSRDWNRMHLEAENNPPIKLTVRLGKWSMPTGRKGQNG